MTALTRYAAAFTAVVLAVGVVAAGGCTSHEAQLEAQVPPPPVAVPVDAARASLEAARLLTSNSGLVIAMSVDALAPFTLAAAEHYRASGAPYIRTLTRTYADTLLAGADIVSPGAAVYVSGDAPRKPSAGATAVAGAALAAAYNATGERSYLRGAREAARGLMGLRPRGVDGAVGYFFFATSGQVLGPTATSAARKLLPAVRAAARRLPARIDGAGLAGRAWILLALASSPSAADRATAGRGALRLRTNAFEADGTPSPLASSDPRRLGTALTVVLLQAVAQQVGNKGVGSVFAQAYRSARADGTITLTPGSSVTAQAYYALAFAERLSALRAGG
jgi:hypothetical protein